MDLDKFEFNIFFDGACSRKEAIGTYAFVVFNQQEAEIYSKTDKVESLDKVTNNIAEGYGVLKIIEYL